MLSICLKIQMNPCQSNEKQILGLKARQLPHVPVRMSTSMFHATNCSIFHSLAKHQTLKNKLLVGRHTLESKPQALKARPPMRIRKMNPELPTSGQSSVNCTGPINPCHVSKDWKIKATHKRSSNQPEEWSFNRLHARIFKLS